MTDKVTISSEVIEDEQNEVTYIPWTDDYAVGFKCVKGEHTSYIYLNPSSSGDSEDVFLYIGGYGDPEMDQPVRWYDPFDGIDKYEEEQAAAARERLEKQGLD